MKTTFNTHTEILEKLNKLTFIKKEGNKLISEEGFALSWEFEFTSFQTKVMPIQLVVRISHEDAIIATWGCSSNEDTYDFSTFIQKTQAKAFEYKFDLQDEKSAKGIALFNNL